MMEDMCIISTIVPKAESENIYCLPVRRTIIACVWHWEVLCSGSVSATQTGIKLNNNTEKNSYYEMTTRPHIYL